LLSIAACLNRKKNANYVKFLLSGVSADASVQDKLSDNFGSVGEFGNGWKQVRLFRYRKKVGRVASGRRKYFYRFPFPFFSSPSLHSKINKREKEK